VGAGNIVVNVGSFANQASANELAGKLRAAGLPVIAEKVQIATGPATRLRVGPFASRAGAEAARLKADAISGSASKVIALDAPAPAAPVPAPAVAEPSTAPATAAATKPAVAAPAAPKPAATVSGYAVQLSAPSVEADANTLRDRARAAGFSSFVQKIQTEGGTRYRVRVGPVADRSAAETLREAVNGKLGTGGIVVANP
jgi:cell division septation protein DedD